MHSHHQDLERLASTLTQKCTECQACVRQCAFLTECGTPKEAAERILAGRPLPVSAFACSLCGLCEAVCPEKLDPAGLFLALRSRTVASGDGILPQHRRIAAYEDRGISPLFSFWALPEGCDTVFFPGCALAGSRPRRVEDVVTLLRRDIPSLGVVLDCCSTISHDLGRDDLFHQRFGELRTTLVRWGIKKVLVACPSCHQTLAGHADDLAVQTIYEALPPPARRVDGPPVTVHDACSTRFVPEVHAAVRRTVTSIGLAVEEMRHRARRTFCCGEGASVPHFQADLAATWTEKRHREAGHRPIIAYCAGCTSFLGRGRAGVHHLLDLYFEPEKTLAEQIRPTRGLRTYWNRWRLKRRLRRTVAAAVIGGRGRLRRVR